MGLGRTDVAIDTGAEGAVQLDPALTRFEAIVAQALLQAMARKGHRPGLRLPRVLNSLTLETNPRDLSAQAARHGSTVDLRSPCGLPKFLKDELKGRLHALADLPEVANDYHRP